MRLLIKKLQKEIIVHQSDYTIFRIYYIYLVIIIITFNVIIAENQMTIQVQRLHSIVMTWNYLTLKKNKIQTMNLYTEWMVFKFEDQKPVLQEIGVDFL